MVIRTARTETNNRNALEAAKRNGSNLVYIPSIGSTCPICAKYEGRVYCIDGSDNRFPPLYGDNAPFSSGYDCLHPNCRHHLVPYFEDKESPNDFEKMRKESNKPFKDNRTSAEVKQYQRGQAYSRQLLTEEEEYQRVKSTLGSRFDFRSKKEFVTAKHRKSKHYEKTKIEYRFTRAIERIEKNTGVKPIDGYSPLSKEYFEAAGKLSNEETESIKYYTKRENGIEINKYLGSVSVNTPIHILEQHTETLNRALSNSSLPYDTLLWRGASSTTIANWKELLQTSLDKWKGKRIYLNSFTSTSIYKDIAYYDGKDVIMMFIEQAGKKGACYVNKISYNKRRIVK